MSKLYFFWQKDQLVHEENIFYDCVGVNIYVWVLESVIRMKVQSFHPIIINKIICTIRETFVYCSTVKNMVIHHNAIQQIEGKHIPDNGQLSEKSKKMCAQDKLVHAPRSLKHIIPILKGTNAWKEAGDLKMNRRSICGSGFRKPRKVPQSAAFQFLHCCEGVLLSKKVSISS